MKRSEKGGKGNGRRSGEKVRAAQGLLGAIAATRKGGAEARGGAERSRPRGRRGGRGGATTTRKGHKARQGVRIVIGARKPSKAKRYRRKWEIRDKTRQRRDRAIRKKS